MLVPPQLLLAFRLSSCGPTDQLSSVIRPSYTLDISYCYVESEMSGPLLALVQSYVQQRRVYASINYVFPSRVCTNEANRLLCELLGGHRTIPYEWWAFMRSSRTHLLAFNNSDS
ncbi:hypothetical protein BC629DRAFT_12178 [Irpex lacteus]|nr:hypothetical protein BC629DRAFT_12178 [Irpex lacteus]